MHDCTFKIVNIVNPYAASTTTKHALFFFPGKISVTSKSGRPQDKVTCVYYGSVTCSYQLVSQISSDNCPQSSVKSKQISVNGDHMNDKDYICFDHEECFQIKYLQFKRDLDLTTGFLQKYSKQNMALSCVISQSTFIFSKLTIEAPKQGVKYVQS